MIGFWKPFRVAVSLVVLLTLTFVFIDFRHVLHSPWYNTFTFFQFVPSFRKFLVVTGYLSIGFILVSILTLLFGRVYCSTLCPMGIFQDVVSYISKRFRKKNRFKYTLPKNVIRYSILVLTIIPLFFGSIYLLSQLDPYSNFGRIFSDLVKPVYNLGNNLLVEVLIKFRIYSLAPFDLPVERLETLIYPASVLVLVIIFSSIRGRLICNTICPVGSLLGLLSKFSIFRISIDKSSCTKCAKCSFVCKSECISMKEQTVDVTRCVGCFNCLSSCEKGGISYKFAYKRKTKDIVEPVSTDSTKRDFLIQGVLLTGLIAGMPKNALAWGSKIPKKLVPVKKNNYCTPPGSISISHFKSACTACHLCVTACQSKVLQPSFMEYGFTGMLQPFMDNHTNYCQIECTRCGQVCPTGAILPLTHEAKKTTQIGVVKFIKQNCIVYNDETSCGSCSEHCPTQAVSMVHYKGTLTIPQINEEICIGCGACEHACPVRPHRAIYVEGNPVHKIAKKPKTHKLEESQTEDFPF